MLTIRQFSYRYPFNPHFQLRIPEFSVAKGEAVYIRGPSGCGKTTFFNLLAGVLLSDLDQQCQHTFPRRMYVMHDSALLPWLTAWQDLAVERALRRRDGDRAQFGSLCETFGLRSTDLSLRTSQLSLGMRQRIEIAKALAFDPDLLILDEAFSGIDLETKLTVMRALWQDVVPEKMAIIGTSHQPLDILRFATRAYTLVQGELGDNVVLGGSVEDRIVMPTDKLMRLSGASSLIGT